MFSSISTNFTLLNKPYIIAMVTRTRGVFSASVYGLSYSHGINQPIKQYTNIFYSHAFMANLTIHLRFIHNIYCISRCDLPQTWLFILKKNPQSFVFPTRNGSWVQMSRILFQCVLRNKRDAVHIILEIY